MEEQQKEETRVVSHDAYETVPQPAGKRATPQIASGYPDDEEYE